MGITFGLLALILLLAGLYHRRRQRRSWLAEERYEERGDWLDKRSGERGTYGSLDAEREQERKFLVHRGRASELTRLLRAYCFDQYPGFNDLSDTQIKTFTTYVREQIAHQIQFTEALQNNQTPAPPTVPDSENRHSQALKKIILDFSYAQFPKLLDLDIALIQSLDQQAAGVAGQVLAKVEALKK